MAVCENCGTQNPSSSLYCQDCGSRLGGWKPKEGAGRMATPPTGLTRTGESAAAGPAPCPRCGSVNAVHMRFCNTCGFQLKNEAQVAETGAVPASPPQNPPAVADNAADVAVGRGSVCWRCFGVGDPGADFCKFCGARYSDAPSARGRTPTPAPVAAAAQAPSAASPSPPASSPSEGAPQAAARPTGSAEPQAHPRAALVSILKDGSDGRRYAIEGDVTDIGRDEGAILLSDDPYLSRRHARIEFRSGRVVLRDLDTANGIYVRIREPVDLADGDMLLAGQQVLRFELLQEMELPLGPATQHGVMVFGTPEVQRVARLVQYTTEGVGRDVHYVYRDETVIGREQGDLVFTDDPFMSRRHASITMDRTSKRFVLRDLSSSNGTAIRLRGEYGLRDGEQFRLGRHLFRFEMGGND